ncbi:secreted Ly-6/uPAR-related protein 1-like [Hippopotamus amphibius kiboko]|uniref:secreted Ly-6/uPAR-related protein 1-like n=1 Tax=Hippopotamus amphibius kiboko TaxID=575201 RepID=UPI0025982334|nr:secreted Ly-6/uPAR-related protein 1-like [Hippopotamus amphibius kiboko]
MAFPRALQLLLTTALTVSLGEALRCFTCEQPTALPLCKNITHCKPEETACKTSLLTVESEFPFHQDPVVISSCSSFCEPTDPDSIGAARPISCCSHDLCNSVGVARLSAGALATLGAVLLGHLLS